jgi:hypothetical protein
LTEKAGNADKVEEAFFDKLSVFLGVDWIGWQGDQIGRILASWAVVYFGQVFLNLQKKRKSLGYSFPTVKDMY